MCAVVDTDETKILDLADAALKEWGRSAVVDDPVKKLGYAKTRRLNPPKHLPETAEEIATRVDQAIGKLTYIEREILMRLYIKRKTAGEIQKDLNLSSGTYQRKLYALRRVVYASL